jgi:hypothetical protein
MVQVSFEPKHTPAGYSAYSKVSELENWQSFIEQYEFKKGQEEEEEDHETRKNTNDYVTSEGIATVTDERVLLG